MKYLFLFSLFILSTGCLNVQQASTDASSSTELTECEQARDIAKKSANGAKVLFCDGFNQTSGKLSTVSTNWMDQN